MRIDIPKGKYILAVSGGVDSMVLLDLLKDHDIVVAHFNHGIRGDSNKDEKLVTATAKKYGLKVEVGRARLGKNASEDQARQARYEFLEKVRAKHQAKAIMTAHHRDDLIETALLNTLRGTKRRGLTALAGNPKIIRPLLKKSKRELIKYAKVNKLKWREDSTNQDERYLRNFLRHRIEKLPAIKLKRFSDQIEKTLKINRRIDKEIAIISQLLIKDNAIKRQDFVRLPADVAREVASYWLKQADIGQVDKKLIDKMANFIKTGQAGKLMPLGPKAKLKNSATVTSLWKA